MEKSVLVFASHSSEDKETYVERIIDDLEECYINVWIDKKKIAPGDNLRKSIFRDGLDKADIVLVFFTLNALKSKWVDREIKHILRDELRPDSNLDLRKVISIFDCKETYNEISSKYPELTDDLLHLMPKDYSKIDLGKLTSAIWSKYIELQGSDTNSQKELIGKEKEILQKEKQIIELQREISLLKSKDKASDDSIDLFEKILHSGQIDGVIQSKNKILTTLVMEEEYPELGSAVAFGIMQRQGSYYVISDLGKKFFQWLLLKEPMKK